MRAVASTLCGALLIALIAVAHGGAVERRSRFPAVDDLVHLPKTSALRIAALGHTELAADLIFIRAVLYFSSAFVTTRNFDWFDGHIDTVNTLDPHFRAPYLFASRATMYNGNPITTESVRSSTHFLEAGLRRFPKDWELAFSLGCNYLFEMKTDDPTQGEQWRRTGARWIRQAAMFGGPPWLPNLAAKIMSDEGELEASIRYLEEAFLTARDEPARESVRNLLAAKQRTNLARLTEAQRRFDERWRRTLPYAPPDLYVLIGDPTDRRLDLPALMDSLLVDGNSETGDRADDERADGEPGRR